MAALRYALQRDVFRGSDERLVGVVHVAKAKSSSKKSSTAGLNNVNSSSFLCAAVSVEQPVVVTVYLVKKSSTNVHSSTTSATTGDHFKKRHQWRLRDLKVVDGKDADDKDVAEFDLHFDRVYKWVASNVQERNTFIACLFKLCVRYIRQTKPDFRNIVMELLEDSLLVAGDLLSPAGDRHSSMMASIVNDVTSTQYLGDADADEDDYQALSEREETDLESLMSRCDMAIGNAEAFTEQLSRDLSILDGANIHTIMASEEQVQLLMDLIQTAIDEATKIEQKLDGYDITLRNVRETMEKIEEKNLLIQVQNQNSLKLHKELEKLVTQLNFKHDYQMILLDGDLTNPTKAVECAEAANALQEAINTKYHPSLLKMAAVQEQLKLFEKLRLKFTQRLSRHLNNLFIHLGNEMGNELQLNTNWHNNASTDGHLMLPRHSGVHRELAPYARLVQWLRATDSSIYCQLADVYADSLSKLYDREVHDFFEAATQRTLSIGQGLGGSGSGAVGVSDSFKSRGRASESCQDLPTKFSVKGRSTSSLLGIESSASGAESELSERNKFDRLFEQMLCELEPICLAEQQFCARFFNLDGTSMQPSSSILLSVPELSNLVRSVSEESILTNEEMINSQKKEKLINEELKKMMLKLFSNLESELLQFIAFLDRIDSFYSMYVLVRLSQHVMAPAGPETTSSSFVSKVFANCLVQAKRNFDRFMALQTKSIDEAKVSKKSKCGIILFVLHFETFAQQAGVIFHGSERRNYLDKCYVKLVEAMFGAIQRIALEQNKTPNEVVMMENFHHLYALLSQLKIGSLDGLRKEAKQKYNEQLQAYVTRYFGRPLDKLNIFFDGVQTKVTQGVKEDEIGYQLAFSKQELRKVIKEYPGKEVKRGLESLYKKVEKHLCEEENLLQVVWRSMQEEFIRQYKYIQDLVERCYPGSMITLEFSIDDILHFFSDIARSH